MFSRCIMFMVLAICLIVPINAAQADTTGPLIDVIPSSQSWTNEPIIVDTTINDVSGVATKEYQLTQTEDTSSGAWVPITGPIVINTEGIWYLHIRSTDNLGNTSTKSFGPYQYQFDKASPSVFLLLEEGKASTTSLDVNVFVKAFDNLTPADEITVQLSTDGNNWTSPMNLNSKGEIQTSILFSDTTSLDKYLTVYVKASDNYSNFAYNNASIFYGKDVYQSKVNLLRDKIQLTIDQTKYLEAGQQDGEGNSVAKLTREAYEELDKDNVAPKVKVKTQNGARATTGNTMDAVITIKDNSDGPYNYWINGVDKGLLPSNRRITLSLSALTGPQKFQIKIADAAGNIGRSSIVIKKL